MNFNYRWCLNKDINKDFIFIANFAFKTPTLGVYFQDKTKGSIGERFTNYKDLKLSLERQYPNDFEEILKSLKKEEFHQTINYHIVKLYLKSTLEDIKQYGFRSLFW
jgi:hypothetical protein